MENALVSAAKEIAEMTNLEERVRNARFGLPARSKHRAHKKLL